MNYLPEILIVFGIVVSTVGWILFRRPDVKYFTFPAPMWRAKEFLYTPGIVLWFGGTAIAVVGGLMYVFEEFK